MLFAHLGAVGALSLALWTTPARAAVTGQHLGFPRRSNGLQPPAGERHPGLTAPPRGCSNPDSTRSMRTRRKWPSTRAKPKFNKMITISISNHCIGFSYCYLINLKRMQLRFRITSSRPGYGAAPGGSGTLTSRCTRTCRATSCTARSDGASIRRIGTGRSSDIVGAAAIGTAATGTHARGRAGWFRTASLPRPG